jgi:hypothetical protein
MKQQVRAARTARSAIEADAPSAPVMSFLMVRLQLRLFI